MAEPIKKGDPEWDRLNEAWLREKKPRVLDLGGGRVFNVQKEGEPVFIPKPSQGFDMYSDYSVGG